MQLVFGDDNITVDMVFYLEKVLEGINGLT
jgi:hypothetical protein